MRMRLALPLFVLLAGCAGQPLAEASPALPGSLIPLGQSVIVGRLLATPLQVLDDSRCPENARCVWAGQLVVQTRIEGPGWRETVPLILGEPQVVHGTTIVLISGQPEQRADRKTPAKAYRLAFDGGRELPVARFGQRVQVDGPEVTPLEIIEDSRCPGATQCARAGGVRLRVAIHLGGGDETRELVLNQPVQVADGALELVEVRPAATAGEAIAPADYRFTFRFDGGI